MTRKLIIENCGYFRMEILPRTLTEAVVHNEGRTGRYPILMEVKGPMTIVGRKNANGRNYPLAEIKKAIGKLKPQLESLCVFGELDHPEKSRGGETSLKFVSHIIKDLWVEKREMSIFNEDGQVERGTFDVLMAHWLIRDSKWGRELANLLEIGCAVGTSMRGFGELAESGDVANYLLKTIDAVDDPSSGTRIIAGLTEGVDGSVATEDVLNEKQSPGIVGLLAATLKLLNEDSDLKPAQRIRYLDAMEGTIRGLTFGEGQDQAVQTLMGELTTMKTKTHKFLESAKRRAGAGISESGDEAIKPGMQSNPVPKTNVNQGGIQRTEDDVFDDESDDMFLDDGDDFTIDGESEDEDDIEVNPDLREGTMPKLEDESDVDEHPDTEGTSNEPDADKLSTEDEGDVEVHPDLKEGNTGSAVSNLRARYMAAEAATKGLKEYSLCLEATVEAMRSYALDLEEAAEDLRDVNDVYEEALTQTRDYALTLESTLNEMTGYARTLEEGLTTIRDHALHLESKAAVPLKESASQDAAHRKVIQEKTQQLDTAIAMLEKLKSHADTQKTELEALKARRAVVNESLKREVRDAIRVSPSLAHFEAELMESKDRHELESRIQKYVRMLESASNMRIDLPPSSRVVESTDRKPAQRLMYGQHPNMR